MRTAIRPNGWFRISLPLVLSLLVAGACNEEKLVTPPPPPPPETPPAQATVLVTIITTGSQPDDFYDLQVDGTYWNKLPANTEFELPLPAGTHTLKLVDLADNCSIPLGNSLALTLTAGGHSAATFTVSCPKFASLDISVATTGISLDPDGYQLSMDTLNIGPFGLQDHVHLDRVAPGIYIVRLAGVAVNCGDPQGSTRTISVAEGSATSVSFVITCEPRPDDTPGAKLVVSSNKSGSDDDLEIIDLAGGQRQRLTDDVGDDQAPEFSPDGNKILFISWQPALHTSKVKILDRATRAETTLPTQGQVDRATWSPDGSQIAFVRSGKIYLMAADGSNERQLTFGNNDRDPYWSPDGSQIVISRDQSVIVVKVADRTWTTLATYRLAGPWAPDGHHILVNILECDYYCYYGGPSPSDLAILDVDSRVEVRLTQTPLVPEWSPVWSPDGKAVYYITTQNGNQDVFVAALSGGDPVNLTNSSSIAEQWVTLGQVGGTAALRSAPRSRRP